MTNTDKAIVFSNKFKCITIGERCKNIEDACYKMAEWKDNKFYLILACIKVSLDKAGLNGDKFIDEIKKQWEE